MQASEQTRKDLEFPKVLEYVAKFSYTERTSQKILNLVPYENHQELVHDLHTTQEFLSSFESENRIPFSAFYHMQEFLPRLAIENYYLDVEDFLVIKANTLQIKELVKFFKNFSLYFPELTLEISKVEYEKEIVRLIETVYNRHGEIRDQASDDLYEIRKKLKTITGKISELFKKSLTHYQPYLDEIRESIVDDKRVLAVNSAQRKRVKGRLLGTSKTGSISYIEPESLLKPYRDLEELKEDEKSEIIKILKKLTADLSPYKEILMKYEHLLEYLDFTQAKAKFAQQTNSVLPVIKETKVIDYKNVYHPLLYLSNLEKHEKTFPQSLRMDEKCRIIIISGPNAGGKSITLKTIGLNQLMIQSGLLIPVHPASEVGFFDQIFTDIGDNQSIENQLSTYSYRLKQMANFIKNVDENSLLLVDEFGTGSDPDLGGALAEVFFEEFYNRKAFGVFTTHYTNIKITAEELPEATNASMLFDKNSLNPLYKLEVGQSGSSFTFEVAEKNKIPYRLINKAKKKVEKGKVNLDKTILKLQQEKFEIQKKKNEVDELKQESKTHNEELQSKQEKIHEKLVDFQYLYETEMKSLQAGKKMNEWADEYFKTKNKKKLINQFLKWVEIENSKKKSETPEQKKKEKIIEKNLKKELLVNQAEVEKDMLHIEVEKRKEKEKIIKAFKIGDRVKILDSDSIATIDRIEKNMVVLNYGKFTMKVPIFDIYKI